MRHSDNNEPHFLVRLKSYLSNAHWQLRLNGDSSNLKELIFVAASFVFIATLMYTQFGYHEAFTPINQLSYFLPPNFLQMLTFLGDSMVCLALLLPFARRNPTILIIALFTAVYGTLLSQGMKAYFDMPRPPATLEPNDFFVTGQILTRHSFPSGHSLAIFSLLTIFYYFSTQSSTKLLLILFGGAVSISRVLVGAHWPIDVFIGSDLGILVALAAIASAKRWRSGWALPALLVAMALTVGSTILLFNHDGGYPSVKPLAMTLSSASLLHFFTTTLCSTSPPCQLSKVWRATRAYLSLFTTKQRHLICPNTTASE